MSGPTVHAVMTVTIEIPVRASSTGETLEQMYRAAKTEAEGVLRTNLPKSFLVVGPVTFGHAVIK